MASASRPLEIFKAGLTESSAVPIYRQLYERVRTAVETGVMPAGTKLPSTRTLAEQLAISRGTVKAAYDMLSGDGYVDSRGTAGTVIAATRKAASRAQVRNEPATIAPRVPPNDNKALRLGVPALDAFPFKLWSRLVTQQARSAIHSHSPDHPEYTLGSVRLRAAIANYLALTRGIDCTVDQIFVTAGYQGALGLITRTLLSAGDLVWFEEPGYFRARDALVLAGMHVISVPVDADGLDVPAGLRAAPEARMAIVTPSHESPLGMAMSLKRRMALLAWADQRNSWILEDDYYSEFWYTSRPIPALKSLDRNGRVLYTGTFSKVMHPSLRLGYIVVPASLIPKFARNIELLSPGPALLTQQALAAFMEQGYFSRHIKRMRQLYAQRRIAMIAALKRHAGKALTIEQQPGGMHLVVYLADGFDDVALSQKAAQAGYGLYALSQWYAGEDRRRGLLLSFANVPADEADGEIRNLVERLGL